MDGSFATKPGSKLGRFQAACDRILEIQAPDGAIPWFEQGPWDAWNHVESAMALCVMGQIDAAARAYDYLVENQRSDGAWFGEYGNALPMVDRDYISREKAPAVLDTNFCAYPVVGIAHYLKVTGDRARVEAWWPMVKRALDFVIGLQRPDGTIPWSLESIGTVDDDSLLAGNASILKSLACGIYLAEALGADCDDWRLAQAKLRGAIQARPHLFDRRGQGGRFAMDWYYPVLSGALAIEDAVKRLETSWDTFVIQDQGCRCVSDEPWVTVAETAELVLALLTVGDQARAEQVLNTLTSHRDEAGVFWMGWQLEEQIFWPREQPSWTQGAVILAADALFGVSDGADLLTSSLA